MPVFRTCLTCGSTFKTIESIIKKGGGKYCSRACYNRAMPSILNRGRFEPGNFQGKGADNPNWKGDKVTYGALHAWVRRRMPKPKLCQICGEKPAHDLSNISGKYSRDLSDWEWICRRCHMEKDGRLERFLQSRKKVKKTGKIATCPVCGKRRYIVRSMLEKGWGKYCSYSCRDEGRKSWKRAK